MRILVATAMGLSLVAGVLAVAAFRFSRATPKFGETSNSSAAEVAALILTHISTAGTGQGIASQTRT